jgi:hypothetical protein
MTIYKQDQFSRSPNLALLNALAESQVWSFHEDSPGFLEMYFWENITQSMTWATSVLDLPLPSSQRNKLNYQIIRLK